MPLNNLRNYFRDASFLTNRKTREDYYLEAVEIICQGLGVKVEEAEELLESYLGLIDPEGTMLDRFLPSSAKDVVSLQKSKEGLNQNLNKLKEVYG